MSVFFDSLRVIQVILGIGGVIFIHEFGHFLAARLCRVRVEVFSLGFGPRLFGLRRGATLYQIAAVPLGGFVKMKGDDGFRADRSPEADDLQSKTVGQRFFIYSAGVIANVLMGLVLFPVLFMVGVPLRPPVVGQVTPGMPAWHARLDPQAEVVSVNGAEIFDWDHIPTAVILSGGEPVELLLRDPDSGAERAVVLHPEDGFADMPDIGIAPPIDPEGRIEVAPGSAAEAAGLESGDRPLAVEGGVPGWPVLEQLRQLARTGATLRLFVDGAAGERWVEVAPVAVEDAPLLGIEPRRHLVRGVRANPVLEVLDVRDGDVLLEVAGRAIYRRGDLERALAASTGPLVVRVRREGVALDLVGPDVSGDAAIAIADDVALTTDTDSTEIIVRPDHAGVLGGLRDGDRIRRIDGEPVATWLEISAGVGAAADGDRPTEIEVMRVEEPGGPARSHTFTIALAPTQVYDYGILRRPAVYTFRTTGLAESLRAGVLASWRFTQEVWTSLARMLQAEISLDQVGGIITIGMVSFDWSNQGLTKLLYFLCILSINLAILNVLPIPVLDGGHLFFLLVEKVKGSPVSERVMGYSQMVGLVLILSLMVYVTFNDIQRWFF